MAVGELALAQARLVGAGVLRQFLAGATGPSRIAPDGWIAVDLSIRRGLISLVRAAPDDSRIDTTPESDRYQVISVMERLGPCRQRRVHGTAHGAPNRGRCSWRVSRFSPARSSS